MTTDADRPTSPPPFTDAQVAELTRLLGGPGPIAALLAGADRLPVHHAVVIAEPSGKGDPAAALRAAPPSTADDGVWRRRFVLVADEPRPAPVLRTPRRREPAVMPGNRHARRAAAARARRRR